MAAYRSFIFPEAEISDRLIRLEKRESHHLVKVMRARAGERVELLDGKGKRYLGRLTKADPRQAEIAIEQVEEVAVPQLEITVLQALPKGKAMDVLLRMVTEIGITALHPVYSDQSEISLPEDRVEGKVEKWKATSIEACKQCGVPFLPELHRPVPLEAWLQENPVVRGELRIVASLEAGSRLLLDTLSARELPEKVVLAVGPEGDFSISEYAALRENGFIPVRLGGNVLRAETATAYLLSVMDQFARSERD